MYAIETRELGKKFGDHKAVDHLSLSVEPGSVFGFLGPNGAGKTTTLRMLVGLARPTSGEAYVLGESVTGRRNYLRRVGFLPDVPGFYSWMRPWEFVSLAGRTFGLGGQALRKRVDEVLELTGLSGVKTRIGGFSRGMKQRLGMAQALVNEPELVFLDEPTSALDPIGRKDVLEAIGRLAGRTTVFFSTHILADVERVCDTVAILKEGRLLTQQRIQDLRNSHASHFIYMRVGDTCDLKALCLGQPWAGRVEPYRDGWQVYPPDLVTAQKKLPELVASHGLTLHHFEMVEPSLEDIFVRLVNEQ